MIEPFKANHPGVAQSANADVRAALAALVSAVSGRHENGKSIDHGPEVGAAMDAARAALAALPVPVGDETEALRAAVQEVGKRLAWNVKAYGKAWTGEDEDTRFILEPVLARVAGLEAREAALLAERDAFRIEADCGLRDYDGLELTAGNLRRALVEIAGYVRSHLAGQDADPELKWALEQADSALADSGEAGS